MVRRMINIQENLDEIRLYGSLLSDYIDQQEQQHHKLQAQLDQLKMKLRSIEYTWKEGRFDSIYHCIVCGKIKPNGHSADCWLNKAINEE